MPYIGEGPAIPEDVLPAWASAPGAGGVPQWPKPNTVRANGWFRINSDPLQRPIATRWLAVLKLIHYPQFPSPAGAGVRRHWFWFDLVAVGGGSFVFDSGSSPGGLRIIGSGDYLEDIGLGLGAGFKWIISSETVVDPPAVRTLRLPNSGTNMSYNLQLPAVFGAPESDPTQDDPVYGPYWQSVDVDAWPLSECFPTDDWVIEPATEEIVIGALFQRTGANLSLNPARSIPWDTTIWTNAGTILDPGDSARLVIPPGFQFARFTFNTDRTSSSNSLTSYLAKNGVSLPGGGLVTQAPGFSSQLRSNVSSAWLEVVASDFFEIWAQSSAGNLDCSSDRVWVAIELGNP